MGFNKPVVVFAFLLILSLSYAENFVAVNSVDGRDVLSGIFYANVKGYTVRFVPVPGGASDIFAAKVGSDHDILLIQSATLPASGLVESELRARGNQIEVYSSSDGGKTNLDLARRSGASSFIIVDSAYSDSAISVMPYAQLTGSYVILADSTNADEIGQIVAGKKVTVYGFLDSSVKAAIAGTGATYIGNGEDKYADNVEIVGKMLREHGSNRAIFIDGSAIEDSMTSGGIPIILTGRIVPKLTYDFIKSEFTAGRLQGLLLLGNELVYPAYDMREKMKTELAAEGINKSIGVIIKFAQAIPSQGGSVMALDLFRVPAYKPSLTINEIAYNTVGKKLMAGLENTGDGPLYYTLELRVKVDGEDYQVFTQGEPKLIERGTSASNEFELDLSSVPSGEITAAALVRYGSTGKSLEEFATSEGKLTTISYVDESNVTVRSARYDKDKQVLSVTVKNNGAKTAYFFMRLTLTDESGAKVKVNGPSIREVETSSLFVEEFPLQLSEKEILLNTEVPVAIDYGGRRGFLLNSATYVVSLEQPQTAAAGIIDPTLMGALIAIAVLVLLYAAYRFIIKKKQ